MTGETVAHGLGLTQFYGKDLPDVSPTQYGIERMREGHDYWSMIAALSDFLVQFSQNGAEQRGHPLGVMRIVQAFI